MYSERKLLADGSSVLVPAEPCTIARLCAMVEKDDADCVKEYTMRFPGLLEWYLWETDREIPGSWTPISLAAGVGSVEVLRVLLEHENATGAYESVLEYDAARPFLLHIACRRAHPAVVRFLLSRSTDVGADLLVRFGQDATPLLAAAGLGSGQKFGQHPDYVRGVPEEDIIRLLVELGADVHETRHTDSGIAISRDLRDIPKDKTRHLSATVLTVAIQFARPSLITFLHEKGAKLDVRVRHYLGQFGGHLGGVTPLHIGCGYRNTEGIKTLLNLAGADSNSMHAARDSLGQLPFHWIILEGGMRSEHPLLLRGEPESDRIPNMISCIDTLLPRDPDALATINSQDNEGMTALHFACDKNSMAIAASLIERGADPRIKNNQGQTAVFNLLNNDCIIPAVQDLKHLFLSKGVSLEDRDAEGNTLLHFAAKRWKMLDVVRYLVDEGVPCNSPNTEGTLPLHAAAACLGLEDPLPQTPGVWDMATPAKAQDAMLALLMGEGGEGCMNSLDCRGQTAQELLTNNRAWALLQKARLERDYQRRTPYVGEALEPWVEFGPRKRPAFGHR